GSGRGPRGGDGERGTRRRPRATTVAAGRSRRLLKGAYVPIEGVPHPEHRDCVAHVVAFEVLSTRRRVVPVVGINSDLAAGLGVLEALGTGGGGDEEMSATVRDTAALAVAALRIHLVRRDVDIDIWRARHKVGSP